MGKVPLIQRKISACQKMTALSEKKGCNKIAQNHVVNVRIYLAILFYASILKYTVF
jgi:hypothetical protein